MRVKHLQLKEVDSTSQRTPSLLYFLYHYHLSTSTSHLPPSPPYSFNLYHHTSSTSQRTPSLLYSLYH
ncbi:hypothetical protein Pcinc_034585 [Petrolisthes cinctipes]|uniref:Uncharacterized protein n=1 Tax=Petrolisthes cinctipes TaxID=88211 RepID=A0AAE1BZR0_PETCI|nr:hypothetical protein Pcinc_034585 [Petrolisthes cinctipes]